MTRLAPLSRGGALTASLVLAMLVALFAAAGSRADTILWNNYDATPETIGFAGIDGSGGGVLNLAGQEVKNPEGMAYDTVTNRLFVANDGGSAEGQITAINVDGGGAANFTAPGAPIDEPEGVTVDPIARTIYWINTGASPQSISWAQLDGSAGGLLNTSGATLDGPYRLALDPVAGRVYWGNNPGAGDSSVSYANVNNSGGGNLSMTGATVKEVSGIAVDPAGGRAYLLDNDQEKIFYVNLNGTGAAEINLGGAPFDDPYGIAVDPSLGRLYWANYGNDLVRENAFGIASINGGSLGGITVATAPSFDSPQDPVILKVPSAAGAPVVTRAKNDRSQLTCPTGAWGADFPGSFVYQAPRALAYQWALNGEALPGATAPTLKAGKPGKYTCAVTATNQAGAATQASPAVNVKAAKAKLTTKKKATVKAGGTATFKVKAVNQGDLKPKKAGKLCVQLPKSAKGALVAPKCKSLGKPKGKAKKTTTLKIKTTAAASGTYSVTFKAKGLSGKPLKAKVVVK